MQYHGSSFSYETSAEMRTAVNRLQELTDLLHPDPKPEVFTLRSFEFRYQRYGLRDKEAVYPAVIKVIEQSQRLNRALNDYSQCGLNEFYAGLIYLYWGDCYAAEKQFDAARRYWSFVYEPASQSLAYVGAGLAQQFTHHDESALISYGRASQSLERLPSYLAGNQQQFREQLGDYVQQLQAALRQKLFRSEPEVEESFADETEPAPASETSPTSSGSANTGATTATAVEPPPIEVPAPLVTMASQSGPPPPRTNLAADPMPIEGHQKTDDAYQWYQVETRGNDELMPQIQVNDWLLVHLRPLESDLAPSEGRPIVTVCESASGGSIQLRPHTTQPVAKRSRIYLRHLTSPIGEFKIDPQTGEVSFPAPAEAPFSDLEKLIGVVVGLWRTAPQVLQS